VPGLSASDFRKITREEGTNMNTFAEIERETLLPALRHACKVAGTRPALPVLQCVRITADNTSYSGHPWGRLVIEATDLEMYYRNDLAAVVTHDEAVCLPAVLLRDLIAKAPKGSLVGFAVEENVVHVSIGARSVAVTSYPEADYPFPPECPDPYATAPNASVFASELKAAALCASTDESRPTLTVVLFESEGQGVRLVATDSYRLGIVESSARFLGAQTPTLIPARAATFFASMIGKKDTSEVYVNVATGPVGYRKDETGITNVSLTSGMVSVTTRMIEGRFPAYRELCPGPETATTHIVFDVASALPAFEAAKLVAKGNTPIKLQIDGTSGTVTATATSTGTADHSEVLEGCKATGETMLVGFNPKFLIDGLAYPGTEQVTMSMIDDRRPVWIHGLTGTRRFLLMPVRLYS
jgi:DNA polymerase-3 subunit beta